MYETIGVISLSCATTQGFLAWFLDYIGRKGKRLDEEGSLADRPLNRIRLKRLAFSAVFAWLAIGVLFSFLLKWITVATWLHIAKVATSPGGAIILSLWAVCQVFWIVKLAAL